MSSENTSQTEKRIFTDYQLRLFQIIIGLFAAAALIVSLFMPRLLDIKEGDLLNYLFVVVFLAIMLGRRAVENKYRLRLSLFSLSLMLGIFAGIIFFTAHMFFWSDEPTNLDGQIKILIIAAMVAVLIAGIVIPAVRYFKRKTNGTLAPIRLPEPKEDEEKLTAQEETFEGPLSIEQKIAAMTRDIENKNDDKQ